MTTTTSIITSASTSVWPDLDTPVVTDGGLETWLLFHQGVDLPAFAAYPLVDDERGRALLTEYYERYLAIAEAHDAAALLEAPTWRANPDWALTLGHDRDELGRFIDASIELMCDLRSGHGSTRPILVSAVIGPRGDGYRVDTAMDPDEAADYHRFQIERSARAGADVVSALTMGSVGEAAGVALAARAAGIPSVISFTVETDGRLPSGVTLEAAITATDDATDGAPHHYMINCAHPSHFASALETGAPWSRRIGGLRANASMLSHAELDEMTELDEGDPDDLASRYVALREALPNLQVIGGCCGTDDRHVAAIADAWCSRT
jgi:S-methylmethionine-dependent homocysteine/selenocysteine methylase